MQLELEIPERQDQPMPTWCTNPDLFTREFAEKHISTITETMRRHNNTKLSNHMDTTWNQGVDFYKEWIQVLDGDTQQAEFEQKWHPICKAIASK